MEKNRIVYLDAVKGFAIFLMVFAHAIGWNVSDAETVCNHTIYGLLVQLTYSFHMPLFFMVSGYLQPLCVDSYQVVIKKRTMRLFIPYLTTGFLMLLVRGYYGYWFLFSMYQLTILYLLFLFVSTKINREKKIAVDTILVICLYVGIKLLLNHASLDNPFCETGKCVGYYLPFFFGVLLKKYEGMRGLFIKESLLSLYIILFVFLFSFRYWITDEGLWGIIANKSRRVLPFLGSLIVIMIFKLRTNKKTECVFSYLGRKSMQIYILHIIFVLQIPLVGDWLVSNLFGVNLIIMQFIYSQTIVQLFQPVQ